jgi:hypothetical protein
MEGINEQEGVGEDGLGRVVEGGHARKGLGGSKHVEKASRNCLTG